MASFIACIWSRTLQLLTLCCCGTLNTVEPLLTVAAARSRVVSTSAAIFFITNWWMSKSLKVWIMTWKLARSKPGRGRAEMQGSSVPLGRNHVSPSGGPLPSWALRIVLTFPPFTAPLPVRLTYNHKLSLKKRTTTRKSSWRMSKARTSSADVLVMLSWYETWCFKCNCFQC